MGIFNTTQYKRMQEVDQVLCELGFLPVWQKKQERIDFDTLISHYVNLNTGQAVMTYCTSQGNNDQQTNVVIHELQPITLEEIKEPLNRPKLIHGGKFREYLNEQIQTAESRFSEHPECEGLKIEMSTLKHVKANIHNFVINK